ncbi:MAG: hypothetical protein GY725_16695 [bacterium]|nr:hypothetical protein [bacterium]
MSFAYTILGVLLDTPSHGYSIKKSLEEQFCEELDVNDGRLYPTLGRLAGLGWIEKEVVKQERSPNKHLYRVTDSGRTAFFAWLGGEERCEAPEKLDFFWKQDFLQKCNFFRHLESSRVAARVRGKIDEVSRCEEQLKKVLEDLELREPDVYRCMIVDYGIRYQRMRREWLEELLARAVDAVQSENTEAELPRAQAGG